MQNKIPRPLWYIATVLDASHNFVAYEVQKHICIREGILEGCTAPSITIKDQLGKTAHSSLDMYHETEEDAWDAINLDLASEIMDKESEIESLQRELQALKDYQSSLV